MIAGNLPEEERSSRWRQLADLYLAQQIALYPPDYIASKVTPERILETVERFEEDLTDKVRVHSPFRAVVTIDKPLEVSAEKERKDYSLMDEIRARLENMLKETGTVPIFRATLS